MREELKPGVVYVCPERDIECGVFARNWCEQCPKRRATPPSPSTAEVNERAEFEAWFKANNFGGMKESMWAAWEGRAALAAKTAETSNANQMAIKNAGEVDVEAERSTIERAADFLEHYAAYCYEVKPADIERHPYIPAIKQAAEELRAMLAARRTQEGAKDGYVLVPINATNEIICAIERSIDSQLVASGLRPLAMQRQDGERVWDAAIAAQTKEQQNAA